MLSERVRSARPVKQEPPGHVAEPTATRPARALGPAVSPVHGRGIVRWRCSRGGPPADERWVERGQMVTTAAQHARAVVPRLLVVLTVLGARCSPPASAPGPHGDVLGPALRRRPLQRRLRCRRAACCVAAAVRAGAERLAWCAPDRRAAAQRRRQRRLRTLAAATGGNGPYPSVADLFCLVSYLLLYVALVGLIRARVPRFHPSMWLDGVIGALGTTARRRSPSSSARTWSRPTGDPPSRSSAWPTRSPDVAPAGAAGRRRRRSWACAATAPCCCSAGAAPRQARRRRRAASTARCRALRRGRSAGPDLAGRHLPDRRRRRARRPAPGPAPDAERSRVGWRLLALPLVCNLASLLVLARRLG